MERLVIGSLAADILKIKVSIRIMFLMDVALHTRYRNPAHARGRCALSQVCDLGMSGISSTVRESHRATYALYAPYAGTSASRPSFW